MKPENKIQNRNKKPVESKPTQDQPAANSRRGAADVIMDLTKVNQSLRSEIASLKAQIEELKNAQAQAETTKKTTATVTFRHGLRQIKED